MSEDALAADSADEDDLLTVEGEGDGDEEIEPPQVEQAGKRKIFTKIADPTVKDLYDRFKDGDLVLQPDFQRYVVWDRTRKSRIIESLLLDVPLPIVYLAEESDGQESVIDGQQRLTSFFEFLDGHFALHGLTALTELNGTNYANLDREFQGKIRRSSIRSITLQKESDSELRFEIFERLNTGSVALNDQELRNCIFRGPYNTLLKDLAAEADFMHLLGLTRPERRMRDVEYVLRFAAFYHASYLNYRPSIKSFLNADMRRYRQISLTDIHDLRRTFKKSCILVRSFLDRNAFKRFYPGDEKNPNGRWEARRFNASLYDVLMYGFTLYDAPQVYPYLDSLREAYISLMTDDADFVTAIQLSTSARERVVARFDKWRHTLDEVIGSPRTEPRCFSFQLKKALFDDNPVCALCGQRISSVDDAAVDHIDQYWRGGKTIPENARLAHRFCNWSRPRAD